MSLITTRRGALAAGLALPRWQLPCVTFIWAAERASFFGLFAAAISEVLAAAGEGRLRARVSLNVTRAFPDPLVSARGSGKEAAEARRGRGGRSRHAALSATSAALRALSTPPRAPGSCA